MTLPFCIPFLLFAAVQIFGEYEIHSIGLQGWREQINGKLVKLSLSLIAFSIFSAILPKL